MTAIGAKRTLTSVRPAANTSRNVELLLCLSDIHLLRQSESIVNLDSKISNSAFELCMA
jgi:hypothetical protein